jgi:predicted DNA-binding transcriptional regulator AlpA
VDDLTSEILIDAKEVARQLGLRATRLVFDHERLGTLPPGITIMRRSKRWRQSVINDVKAGKWRPKEPA